MHEINSIKLSDKEKKQLIYVKSKTGVQNWNVLCRWALCLSLKEKSVPPVEDISSESNVEMSWKTLGGNHADIYQAIILKHYFEQKKDLGDIEFHKFFKLHLARGISYLTKQYEVMFNFH